MRRGYSACFVKVITDEVIFGYGESLVREVSEATAKIIEKLLKPIIVGNEPFDIVQSDIVRAGGITECLKIANLARIFNMPYTPHIGLSGAGCRAASIHL